MAVSTKIKGHHLQVAMFVFFPFFPCKDRPVSTRRAFRELFGELVFFFCGPDRLRVGEAWSKAGVMTWRRAPGGRRFAEVWGGSFWGLERDGVV